jgi:hypothetical protein
MTHGSADPSLSADQCRLTNVVSDNCMQISKHRVVSKPMYSKVVCLITRRNKLSLMAAGGWARRHLDGIKPTRDHQGGRRSHQTPFRDQLYCVIMFSNVG